MEQQIPALMLDNAPGGIVCARIDRSGELRDITVNSGFAELLGFADRESCTVKLRENPYIGTTAHDREILRGKASEIAASGGGQFKHIFKCETESKKEKWLLTRVRVNAAEDGGTTAYAFVTDVTDERKTEEELRVTAYFDPLTGLYNRSSFIKNAQRVLDADPLSEFSIMKLDIGSFKVINDILGRIVGDRILIKIADVLREIIGKDGVYARFFADNFMMLIPYSERSVHPRMILDSVQKAIAEDKEISHEIQTYIGVYKITDRGFSVENMIDRASIACRSINGSFREHIAYYDENMRRKMIEEQEICDESHRALRNGEFYVCYQPIYGIKAKKFVSAEALVRWNHPTKGMIPPARFIPVFERNGFVAELDLYVLEQVCIYMKKRRDSGLPPFPISVNVSRRSLYNPNIFSVISELTTRYKVDPKYFRIEITESAYNDNPAQLLETVGRLRGKCYPVLMDDFGSGYSSLNTLKDIPIDILKLDMKFMQGFENNVKVGTIVTAIARMSKWLNVPMLAEGVETKAQYDFLVSIGCSYIQGFYFSRPVPEKDFTDLIAMEEVSAVGETVGGGNADFNMDELLGSNPVVSKFIGSVFGGLGIYEMVDDRLELIRMNDGYLQIMGYTVDDLNGGKINIWQHVHPDDVDISRNACLEAMRTDSAVRATVRRYDRSGELLYLEGIHRRLGGPDEQPIFCIAFNSLNEKIKSDKILENTWLRTKEILTDTGSIAVDVDYETKEVFFVGDWDFDVRLDVFDAYAGDSSPFEKIIHPDDAKDADIFHSTVAPVKRSVELRLKNKTDGRYYWWRFTCLRQFGEDGNIKRMVGVGTDINDEKIARRELEIANSGIDFVMNNLTVGILFLKIFRDGRANIVFSSNMFWKIIGKHRAESASADVLGSAFEADLKRVAEGVDKESARMEHRVVRDDGKPVWIEITFVLSDRGENSRTFMAAVSDVTERHESKADMDAVIRCFDGGIALLFGSGGKLAVEMINDKFYDILSIRHGSERRIAQIVSAVLSSGNDTADMRIRRSGMNSTVRVHVAKADPRGDNAKRYAVTVNDVTLKRAEAKERVSERMSCAAAGIYDEIYEINLRSGTMKLVSSRRISDSTVSVKPFSLSAILREWTEKFIHPSDAAAAMKLFLTPLDDPDFTDAYREIRMKDRYGNGGYHKCGITVVRSRADACMVFIRGNERVRGTDAETGSEEINRLYNTFAERTRFAVLEYDCAANRVVCSPNFAEYRTHGLAKNGTCGVGFNNVLDVHPEDKPIYDEFLKSIGESGSEKAVCVRLGMTDGGYEMRRITAYLKREAGENTARLLMAVSRVLSDVQELKEAGKADDLMRRTVRNIPVGIGIFRMEDGKPVPVYISENVYAMYGIDPDKPDAPVLPVDKLFEDGGLYGGAEGEYALESYHADGSKFWLSVKYRVIEEQGALMLYAALSDVTDRVESVRHEAAERQMYQVLLSETGTVLFDYRADPGVLTYFMHSEGERSRINEAERLFENPSGFTLLKDSDRAGFISMLKSLIDEPGSGELTVRIEVDGYPRRYKAFMKSVCDADGSVYEVIGKMEDAEDEMARLDKIRAKAMYDSLCVNIYNKATTEELIRAELEQSTGGALLMIDVDDFKSINDKLGHLFGDEFLKKFAGTVKGVFRDTDIVGRYGGDEFVVFMPHVSAALAEKKGGIILERVMKIEVPELGSVKSSIGVAAVTPENRSYPRLLKQTDSALYQAKNKGKNRVVVFDPATMTEGAYRTGDASRGGASNVVLSSNPNSASSTFMRVFSALYSGTDINEGITQMLELVGKTYDVSRVYIFEDSEDGKFTSNTFEWCGDGVTSEKDSLQNVSYERDLGGNYSDNMNDDGIFYCHDVSELEVSAQREILMRQGIKSVLQCSIVDGGKFKGFVGFDECRSNRFWTQDQIDSLVFLSKVLSIFLMKERLKAKKE